MAKKSKVVKNDQRRVLPYPSTAPAVTRMVRRYVARSCTTTDSTRTVPAVRL